MRPNEFDARDVDRHVYQVLTKRPHRMAHLIRLLRLPLPSHI